MKKIFLILFSTLVLWGCGNGMTTNQPSITPPVEDDDAPPSTPTAIVPKPMIACGGVDCFAPLYAPNPDGVAGEMWSSVPGAYQNQKNYLDLMNEEFKNIDLILRANGTTTCEAIPGDGAVHFGEDDLEDYFIDFRDPTVGFTMNPSEGIIYTEKRMIIYKNGNPMFDVEIHCGTSSGVKSLQVVWYWDLERIHLQYQINMTTGNIDLVGGHIITAGTNRIFGFKHKSDGGFRFINLEQFGTDFFLMNAETDPTNPSNIEYVSRIHQGAPNDDSLDDIPYGYAVDIERVCAKNFKTSSPVFSLDENDCHSSGVLADTNKWFAIVGFNSGAPWTTEYLDGLLLPDPTM